MDKAIVGVNDLILLEKIEESTILGNLQKRFDKNLIYTSIGNVIISVNPYKNLDIYNKKVIAQYKGRNPWELPPHIFSVADQAFQYMRDRGEDQCIIITGESGSGKTEGSKRIMQYISEIADAQVEKIKEQLLNSNPLLEAWGNAKTLRNDNSSRFGKYMDIQFDHRAIPSGGMITVYLLEKSRVTNTAVGSRNFHIFYQLLKGGDDALKKKLKLGNSKDFNYLSNSKCDSIQGVDDRKEFQVVLAAMKSLGISGEVQTNLFETLAAILHLGNITFKPSEDSGSVVSDMTVAQTAANLLGISVDSLCTILTSRKLKEKGGPEIKLTLDVGKANSTRESLAKALYGNMFTWFVNQINIIINHEFRKGEGKSRVIGVLDIYGFEVLQKNSFEQLCINYTNEKLQQLFIEQTLKTEQEEYAKEGIKWTHIEYFNNQIICDLIETKKGGILAFLDEECIRPGQVSDLTFLDKLDANVIKHPHFDSKVKSPRDKELTPTDFRLKHYAGDVLYSVDGFLEKNNDTLYKEIRETLNGSKSKMIREMFPVASKEQELKRPETLATQFKSSIQLLIADLSVKTPHYVRCIKPNSSKSSTEFDEALCQHQSRYLGLLESVRVRRAGMCFRMSYTLFLERFKMLSPETWPFYKKKGGIPMDGVVSLFNHLKVVKEEFQTGNTKVFIKSPNTLSEFERKRNEWKNGVGAPLIQKIWKGRVQRQKYLKLRAALLVVQSLVRMFLAKRLYKRIKVMRGTAIKVFKDKAGFQKSIPFLFVTGDHANVAKTFTPLDGPVLLSLPILKYHRSNINSRPMVMILTTKSLYLVTKNPTKPILKQRIPLDSLTSIGMSPFEDDVLLYSFKSLKGKGKGDLMIQLEGGIESKERLVEFVTWALTNSQAKAIIHESIQANFKGKPLTIQFVQNASGKGVSRKMLAGNLLVSV